MSLEKVIEELKRSNEEERQRDSRRLNQATAHNQDQGKRFDSLAAKLGGRIEATADKQPSASKLEEDAKEDASQTARTNTLLQKIAGGIGGILGNMKDKAAAAGKTFMDILKGTLLAGLFFAAAKFFNSPLYAQMIDVITNKIIPFLIPVANFLKEGLGKLFTGLSALFTGDFKTAFEELFSVKAVAALAAITALFAPKLLFKGLKGGVKLFTKGIGGALSFLENQGKDLDKANRQFKKRKGIFARLGNLMKSVHSAPERAVRATGRAVAPAASKIGNVFKGGLRVAGAAARFAGPIGVAVTAGMGLFDGITAGIEEYKKSGKIGAAVKEGFAGTLSGLSFGLIPQESISGFFDSVGNTFSTAAENTKIAFGNGVESMKKIGGDISEKFSSLKESAMGKLDELKDLATPGIESLKDIGGDLKEKFLGLKDKASAFIGNIGDKIKGVIDKMPSISEVGDKISGFFGFGDDKDDAKKLEEHSQTVAAFEQQVDQLTKKVLSLEDQVATSDNIRLNALAELKAERLKRIEENALARNGTSAPNININAPSDNKVTQSTSNTTSNTTTIVNTDPILQAAMI